MRRFGLFTLEVLVSLVLNVTASLFNKPQAIIASKWGWLVVLTHATYLIGSSDGGTRAAVRLRTLFGDKAMLSYMMIGLLSAGLGMLYWVGINKAYAALFKEEVPEAKTTDKLEEKPPTLMDLFKSGFPNTMKIDGNSWGLLNGETKVLEGPTR